MGLRPYSRVVWSEGMHLAQHHFQAQSSYFEASAAFALSRLFFKPYGFIQLNLDEEAIREGTVSLLEARGVMPDGLAFDFPQGDPLPAPLEAREGDDPGGGRVPIFLAIPSLKPGRSNCDVEVEAGSGLSSEHRYRAEKVQVQDENTGLDKRDLLVASKNFRAVFSSEITEDLVTLPLAMIQRGPSGHFEFVHDFIPPSLHLGASRRLPAMAAGLVEMLQSKAEVMAQRRKMVGHDLADLSSEEVLSYWMSHAIHSGLAGLSHLKGLPRCHPENLFREMSRLAGTLSTFSTEFDPGDLPPYAHDDLTECFTILEKRVRQLLQVMVPEGFIAVPLGRQAQNLLSASLDDKRVFRPSEWVIRVSSESGDSEVLRNVPALVKVCSAEDILRLVDDANPGLPLEHIPQPPSSIPRRLGSQYFRAVQTGPCWQLIEARSSIGIYVPDVLGDADMELIVVQD
jgi:type VI secretion system protein ImpJ